MLRAFICSALMALAARTAGAAEPDAYSANYMLPYCKGYLSGSNNPDLGFCAGVVEGIGLMAEILEMSSSPGAGPPSCVPNGVTPRPNSASCYQLHRGAAEKNGRAVLAVDL
jgi:hypothetical protein